MEEKTDGMPVTVGIVAYNEEEYLPRILNDILGQSYFHEKMEVLLIDSMSEDGTREQMEMFADRHAGEFRKIQVLENAGRIQCCGWNLAIESFTTEALIRVDAHAHIPEQFVEKNVRELEQGEMVVGGIRPAISEKDSSWSRTLQMVEESLFGSSISDFRRKSEKTYVKSIFHAAYRREVFDRVGKFNENLGRTEDNEFHYRVRKEGYHIAMSPEIISYQYIRPTLRKMLGQKYGNGYWIGLTTGVCPRCLSLYYFVPACFVVGIAVTTILAFAGYPLLSWLMWGSYALVAVLMSLSAVVTEYRKGKQLGWTMFFLPVLFPLLHICYGLGTLVGLIKMPFWKGGRSHE